YYSGSGEPFMHPHIMEILEYTKNKNLICHVNTNFTLLNKERLDCLINLRVDFLTVSTWAATPQTYAETHPNLTEEDFCKIRENLIYLNTRKKDRPCVKLYNVLFNMNYFEVEKMVEFAAETKSESLEFTLVDTMPNATDILALNKEQLVELKQALTRIKYTLDKNNKVKNADILIFQFDQFLRRIYVDEDVQEARYDRNTIDNMPCYIGWLFARIIPNGEVHSCLKAHRIPTGSLYSDRFLEIWDSPKQVHFRKKTLVCKKEDPFFRSIGNDANIKEAGCYKSCDDIGRNTWMHDRIKMLTGLERLALKGAAKAIKIAKKIRPKKQGLKGRYDDPVIAGVLHGRKAFSGPEQVVIDPTNRCNLKCASCWLYSPLLEKDKPSSDLLSRELSKDALVRLIDDLSSLGTKRVRFTGGGEPFMHKDLMDVIEYARSKKLIVAVTTNFGLVSKKDIKRLVDLGLEELCISIWASNAEIYKRVHPGVSQAYFEKLKDNLSYLKEVKNGKQRVTFANVLMNSNFKDFEDMYDFGIRYSADAIYYTLVDVLKGQTDKFLLNEADRQALAASALHIKEKNKKDNIQLEFFDGFIRRLSKSKGDFEKGEYDTCDIDRIPCYVGWTFSRILADGNIAPCCRGVKKIIGNINTESFKEVWRSEKYREFRSKAKFLSKAKPYFREIGCTKECDNLMHNQEMHRRLNNG
ncbi:radical SAM protein, partial [Candidatus Omnitrophota bacterium]